MSKAARWTKKIPDAWWLLNGLPVVPWSEYKFHPIRKWRFDYCFVKQKLAIEIEGGVFSKGRHVRGVGYINDMEKYNSATLLGYRILRYQPGKINISEIKEALSMANNGGMNGIS